jgi:hypothetical protein
MLLEKIAEEEKVEVTQDEIDEELGKIADYYRTTAEEIRKSFEKQDGLDNIKNNLRTRKAIEALVSKAKVVEGPWVDEKTSEPVVEEEGRTEKKKTAKKTTAKKAETAETEEAPKKETKKKTAKQES